MNIADPKYLESLRDLPSGYLLDLIADDDDIDKESLCWVLQERGLEREEIERKLKRRRSSTWSRPHKLWKTARWLTIFNTLIVAYFNITGFYRLLYSDHAFRGALLFLTFGCIICGFLVGLKLTTHLYQGASTRLCVGFPVPVGSVDLKTGDEVPTKRKAMLTGMTLNALVGVNLTLFPLIFIYIMMD